MKVLFIAACFVAGAFARSTVQEQGVFAEGPRCPIDDPLIREGPVPMNITLDPLLNFEVGSELTNLIAEGLSGLKFEVDVQEILLTARFDVNLTGYFTGNSTVKVAGYLDARPLREITLPSGNVTGGGLAKISGRNARIQGSATLFINVITNKVGIFSLNLNVVTFEELMIDLGQGILVNGKAVDWAEINKDLKKNFDEDFKNNKNPIEEKLRVSANNIFGKYTIREIIDIINGGGGEQKPCDEQH